MATVDEVAQAHYQQQQRLSAAAALAVARAWEGMGTSNLTDSWLAELIRLILELVTGAQRTAAAQAPPYLEALALAQGASAPAVVAASAVGLVPGAFAGVASDGRPLESLLYLPVIRTKRAIADGRSVQEAMRQGRDMLTMLVATQVADAGRVAVGVGMTANRRYVSYVRHVVLPACSRCIVLAMREYSWSTGFQRHPQCDCVHIPHYYDPETGESSGLIPPDPKELFGQMTGAQQDKAFGKAGAQAVRDGADIGQIVNARRGMATAGGRLVTTEGTTARGIAGKQLGELRKMKGQRYRRSQIPRPMPEQIYLDAAGDRDLAIALLKRFKYVI